MRLFLFIFLTFTLFTPFPANANQELTPFIDCDASGSTTLYSLKNDEWYQTDENDSELRTLPASTFKIFHSLIALDQGKTTIDDVFKWDEIEMPFSIWNRDTKFEDAFKNSTVWVYEELAQRISASTYAQYLKWADYEGNGNIHNGKKGNFWVYGDWGVSPKEQVNMLIKFYKNELPFSLSAVQKVKSFMKDGHVYGKTGWTNNEKHQIGWWIGYVENESDTVFFATRLLKDKNKELGNFLECRKAVTNVYLKEFLNN